jgi:hypothetical protein
MALEENMKNLKFNLIIAVALMAMLVAVPMLQAQENNKAARSKSEKVALKNFFNALGDLAVIGDDAPEAVGRKATADLVRSLGYIAAEENLEGEDGLMVRDLFLDLGTMIEAGEDAKMGGKAVGKFLRGLGKLSASKSGNISSGKLFDLIATAVEKDGFGDDEKLEREFVKNLFNVLGDIALEGIDEDMDEEVTKK